MEMLDYNMVKTKYAIKFCFTLYFKLIIKIINLILDLTNVKRNKFNKM